MKYGNLIITINKDIKYILDRNKFTLIQGSGAEHREPAAAEPGALGDAAAAGRAVRAGVIAWCVCRRAVCHRRVAGGTEQVTQAASYRACAAGQRGTAGVRSCRMITGRYWGLRARRQQASIRCEGLRGHSARSSSWYEAREGHPTRLPGRAKLIALSWAPVQAVKTCVGTRFSMSDIRSSSMARSGGLGMLQMLFWCSACSRRLRIFGGQLYQIGGIKSLLRICVLAQYPSVEQNGRGGMMGRRALPSRSEGQVLVDAGGLADAAHHTRLLLQADHAVLIVGAGREYVLGLHIDDRRKEVLQRGWRQDLGNLLLLEGVQAALSHFGEGRANASGIQY
uniref:Uncharacterized protein n=1 Tax=Spironucleus salmonicida TaxID=348837 RepID=V6LUV9_9EUKA|eukprot:EST48360.1 Hypothetical protein SS50377_11477 [Spironucleus salmonicida]